MAERTQRSLASRDLAEGRQDTAREEGGEGREGTKGRRGEGVEEGRKGMVRLLR